MAGQAASFQDRLDRFLKGSEIRLGNSLAGARDCGAGFQEPGFGAAQVPGLLQGRWVGSILGDQYRADTGDDQQDGKSQKNHESPFLVGQLQSEVCPVIHGGVEGRDNGGRLLDASGSVTGSRGSVRFQCAAGSMAARHYINRELLHLDLLAADEARSSKRICRSKASATDCEGSEGGTRTCGRFRGKELHSIRRRGQTGDNFGERDAMTSG